ncbi:hypothetical protein OEZ85_006706 [Tetradesmus obliquus]|uniref:Secreted protein n=1 Tax=Tetradesmus obliquus TaxID=3088 RepID=A0ABY8TVT6_TETOB|nr:hypothetical protein OEZ85_006706 [Tetradesmus obliquus]
MHQHFWPGLFILLVTLVEAASESSSTGTAEYNHARYSGGAAEIAGVWQRTGKQYSCRRRGCGSAGGIVL